MPGCDPLAAIHVLVRKHHFVSQAVISGEDARELVCGLPLLGVSLIVLAPLHRLG